MGKMWLSGEGEEGDDRWDPHVSKELESSGGILGPYENTMVYMWVHVVYGRRKWHIVSFGCIVMALLILDEK